MVQRYACHSSYNETPLAYLPLHAPSDTILINDFNGSYWEISEGLTKEDGESGGAGVDSWEKPIEIAVVVLGNGARQGARIQVFFTGRGLNPNTPCVTMPFPTTWMTGNGVRSRELRFDHGADQHDPSQQNRRDGDATIKPSRPFGFAQDGVTVRSI